MPSTIDFKGKREQNHFKDKKKPLRKTNIWIHAKNRKSISGIGGRLTQKYFSNMKYEASSTSVGKIELSL